MYNIQTRKIVIETPIAPETHLRVRAHTLPPPPPPLPQHTHTHTLSLSLSCDHTHTSISRLATAISASRGHLSNQSMAQQLTSEGN